MPAPYATRFAPSPTGPLHLGHALSALTGFDAAQAAGGRFLLRIEDIDAARARPKWEQAIYDDLAWLGIAWERPVRRQSEHMADYHAALTRLEAMAVLYRCWRTRREVAQAVASAPHGAGAEAGEPPFRGGPLPPEDEARALAAGRPFAWRLSLERARARLGARWAALSFTERGDGAPATGRRPADPQPAGDVVLARRDVGVAYHLAVVVDDALQVITEVTRGADLYAATPVQRLLQTLLDLPEPAYRHHRLVLDADGRRLAKRDGAQALSELRAQGITAADVRARLGLAPGPA